MKIFATRLLKTYDWHSINDFLLSLMPSPKYGMHKVLLAISITWVPFDKIFGLDSSGIIALAALFAIELITGISAAIIQGEKISSIKLSRFGLKVACYLVLIGVSYELYQSFTVRNKTVPAYVFDWLNVFLIVQISLENFISVLENLAVISGKDKSAWITKITDVFKITK